MKAAAIACWAGAWCFAGLTVASLFAAKNGKRDAARAELAAGVGGAVALTLAGLALW